MDRSRLVRVLCVGVTAIYGPMTAAGDAGYYSVFRSKESGQTWTRSDSGLPRNVRINAFSAIGQAILAGTDRGIYICSDHGWN